MSSYSNSVQRATYNHMSWYQINSRYRQSTCLSIWNYIATWITITGDVNRPSWRRECLFNSLFRLTTKKHQRSALSSLCEWNPPMTGGFPAQRYNNADIFPFDDVIIIIRYANQVIMMTTWHGHAFRTTGPLWWEPRVESLHQQGPLM